MCRCICSNSINICERSIIDYIPYSLDNLHNNSVRSLASLEGVKPVYSVFPSSEVTGNVSGYGRVPSLSASIDRFAYKDTALPDLDKSHCNILNTKLYDYEGYNSHDDGSLIMSDASGCTFASVSIKNEFCIDVYDENFLQHVLGKETCLFFKNDYSTPALEESLTQFSDNGFDTFHVAMTIPFQEVDNSKIVDKVDMSHNNIVIADNTLNTSKLDRDILYDRHQQSYNSVTDNHELHISHVSCPDNRTSCILPEFPHLQVFTGNNDLQYNHTVSKIHNNRELKAGTSDRDMYIDVSFDLTVGRGHTDYGFQPHGTTEYIRYHGPCRHISGSGLNWYRSVSNIIIQTGVPNYQSAKIVVPSTFKLDAWDRYLEGYFDNRLIDYLRFGFPLSLTKDKLKPSCTSYNHASAHAYSEHVTEYFRTESRCGAMLGPFDQIPLDNFHTSPMLTREKDISDRRIIVDLSYPDSAALNDAVTSHFDGTHFDLSYPTVEVIVDRINKLGADALLYKVDLKRAFRNLMVDPADIHVLGLTWQDKYYVDLAIPFGYNHGSACCQRVTDAIRHICAKRGYWLFAYVDDMIGLELPHKAFEAYEFLLALLEELGLPISTPKSVPPSPVVTCIGITVDILQSQLRISEDKLSNIWHTCLEWRHRKTATRRRLQSLLGKLIYVSKCVPPARLFVGRMLALLRSHSKHDKFPLSGDFFRDLNWFIAFLTSFNGVTMFPQLDHVFEIFIDASPYGLGGIFQDFVYAVSLPLHFTQSLSIVHLEMLNALVALRIWAHYWRDTVVSIKCDNMAVVAILNSLKSKDLFLLACARNIWAITAKFNITLRVTHISGKRNVLADILSRWYTKARFNDLVVQYLKNSCTWFMVPEHYLQLNWDI